MTVYELIDMLRLRTGMYIGYESPTHLNAYLSGYRLAKIDDPFIPQKPSFHGFHDWVANKFDYAESTSGWAYMIEDQREDKGEALLLFFELLDEYRGIQHQQIAKIKFDHEDKLDRSWRGYSRLKKVRGTFEAAFMPSPEHLIIRKMNMPGEWFQMLARLDDNSVLCVWSHEDLGWLYKKATDMFGIKPDEWVLEP